MNIRLGLLISLLRPDLMLFNYTRPGCFRFNLFARSRACVCVSVWSASLHHRSKHTGQSILGAATRFPPFLEVNATDSFPQDDFVFNFSLNITNGQVLCLGRPAPGACVHHRRMLAPFMARWDEHKMTHFINVSRGKPLAGESLRHTAVECEETNELGGWRYRSWRPEWHGIWKFFE